MTRAPVAEGEPARLLVSVTEIRRRPGSRLDVRRELEAAGLALPDVQVPDGATVVLEGVVESIHEGVVLTASVTVPWSGHCRRCLDEVSGVSALDIREVWETRPTEGETWPLEQDHIDVGTLLHDTALLALPLAPLCGDDCQGPAPEVLPVSVAADPDPEDEDEAGEAGPPRDPRWAALDDLQL